MPAAADWTMATSLPAAWAWRFARGVAPLGGPLRVVTGGGGGKFTTFDASRAEAGSRRFIAGVHHFVMLEVGEAEIRGTFVPVDPGDELRVNWHEEADTFAIPLSRE